MNPNPQHITNRSGLDRRTFFRTALAGAGAAALPNLTRGETGPASPDRFAEPGRDVPLVSDVDVIVCGAGPAGVAAAITAARGGARVRLFEWRGCVGGVWTAGLLGYLLDFNKPGFARELATKLAERGVRRGTSKGSITYEPEGMKLLLEDLLVEAGVKMQLHTRVAAAYRDGRRLATIVTESKSGRQAWRAPVFIDTTGDGDLGALAGCEWEIGEAKDCPCQPMSLNALLVCKDAATLAPFIHVSDPDPSVALSKKAFLAEIRRAGLFPSYSSPTLWQVRDNLLLVMMNQEFGIKPYDAAEVTAATIRARAELNRIVNALRSLGGPWEAIQIAATAEQIGVRDGRRIRGRYVVTEQDVIAGARHEDAVVRPTFGVDIHALTAEHNETRAIENKGIKVKPYDIPLRALIAKDVDGLMMAGRCISGDFIAHASYRVTGNATSMGEAAGAVAALAAKSQRLPHQVEWSEAVALLTQMGQRG
jgi:hypothetical protein